MALPSNIQQSKQNAYSLTGRANEMSAYEPSVSDVLKEKIGKVFNDNQDIINPLDTATQDYYNSPNEARDMYSNPESDNYVFNPFSQENLVGQFTGNKAIPMLTLASILGQRFGRVDDVLGAGTRAYQAETGAAQGKAELAQNQYQDELGQYRWETEQSGKGGLGAAGQLEVDALKRRARGLIMMGLGEEDKTFALEGDNYMVDSDENIKATLLRLGQDPDDPFFSDLFGRSSSTKKETVPSLGERLYGQTGTKFQSGARTGTALGPLGTIPGYMYGEQIESGLGKAKSYIQSLLGDLMKK